MKLELSFGSFKDLKEQLQIMIDELSVSNTLPDVEEVHPLRRVVDEGPAMIENPVVARQREFDAKQAVKAPKKRTRRTKEQIEAEKTKPVETAPVVEQPTLPEVVAPVVENPVPTGTATPDAPALETPKNFYSPSEFVANFVIIINNLLNNGSLGIGDIEAACKYYDVKLIYMVGKDLAMCEHFYNDLVSRQIITKKGDY